MFTSGRIIQLISELPELIEIDAQPESKGVRNHLRRRLAAGDRSFAQTSTYRAIDGFLERNAKLLRTPLQLPGQIIIEGSRWFAYLAAYMRACFMLRQQPISIKPRAFPNARSSYVVALRPTRNQRGAR